MKNSIAIFVRENYIESKTLRINKDFRGRLWNMEYYWSILFYFVIKMEYARTEKYMTIQNLSITNGVWPTGYQV